MVLIHISCCKQNIEMPNNPDKFSEEMYRLELIRTNNEIKHLRCLK